MKMMCVMVVTTLLAGLASAGVQAAQAQGAALPQPSTVFLCTAGMAFLRYLGGTGVKRMA